MLDAGCRMCDVLLTVQYGQCVVLVPGGGAGRERVESGQPMVTASLHAPLELQMNLREVSQLSLLIVPTITFMNLFNNTTQC